MAACKFTICDRDLWRKTPVQYRTLFHRARLKQPALMVWLIFIPAKHDGYNPGEGMDGWIVTRLGPHERGTTIAHN